MIPATTKAILITLIFFLVLPPIAFIVWDVAYLSVTESYKIESLFSKPYYLKIPLMNSIFVCGISAALSTFLGLALAWILARRSYRREELLLSLLTGPYIMPSFAMAIGWVLIWTKNGFFEKLFGMQSPIYPYGPFSLIVIFALHNYPLALLSIYTGLKNLNPELEEAAKIHGIPSRSVATKIVLPLIRPHILSGFILSFAYSISEFGAPAVLGIPVGYPVLTTMIYSFMTVAPIEYELAEALSLILSAIGISLLAINYLVLKGKKYVAISGKAGRLEKKKGGKIGILLISILLLLVYLPIGSVAFGSFIKTIGLPITLENIGLYHFQRVLSMGRVLNALSVTFLVSVLAATFASLFGFLVAYMIVREKGISSKIADYVIFLPFSIPGLVIGVGLIVASGKIYPLIYGTWVMLLIAFIIRFLPYATRTLESNIMQLDESLEEASRIHGVSLFKTLRGIVLPILMRGLLSSWVFVFNSSVKELSASAILSVQVETAIVVAFMMFSEGFFGDGAALTTILIAITLFTTWLLSRLTKAVATGISPTA
ncbi:MAG: iron ABC transporter permease [Fervidicoccaceae archaeon]